MRASDAATNQAVATRSFTVDGTAPDTQIDSGPAALVNSATAVFSFSGEDPGGSGVAAFECKLDEAGFSPCSSGIELTGLGEGSHTFEVRAIDEAGNVDASAASHEWTVDTVAPAVQVDSGPEGLTNDNTPTFAFSSEPGAGFECSIDQGTADFGPCSAAGSHTPAEPLADGEYTFRVRASDAATNQAVATRSFEVDTAASDAPELTATVPSSPANDNTPQILGSAPAGTTVRLYTGPDCNGAPIATVTPAELEAGVEATVPGNSTTSFRATATTAAENTSGCSEALVYVEDSSAPTTAINSHPPAPSGSPDASFGFSGNDGGGSGISLFQCRRDGEPWAACTSPKSYGGLADGDYTFSVRAVDRAGNVGSPASFTWTVDTSTPQQTQTGSSNPSPSGTGAASPSGTGVASPSGTGATAKFAELVRILHKPRKGTAVLVFDVSRPGLLSAEPPPVSSKGAKGRTSAAKARKLRLQKRRIKPRSIRITRPGRVKVPIALTGPGKKLLGKRHRLRVKVMVRYRSVTGSKASWKIAVTLKKKEARPKSGARRGPKKK